MPEYTYICEACSNKFELFLSYSEYQEHPKCQHCKSNKTHRSYSDDLANAAYCVKKHNSELRTVGDLANRNRDSMSDDHKAELYAKHNAYKEETSQTKLPTGMKRLNKPKSRPKWTE